MFPIKSSSRRQQSTTALPPSLQTLDTIEPEPEPPPPGPVITVTTVHPHECMHHASYPAGIPYSSNELSHQPPPPQNNNHLLWDTHISPTSELNDKSFSPAAIIRTLAIHDKERFTTTITKQFLKSQFLGFKSAVKLTYLLQTAETASTHLGRLTLTSSAASEMAYHVQRKEYFTLSAPTALSFQSPCFTQRKPRRPSYHQRTQYLRTSTLLTAGSNLPTVPLAKVNYVFTKQTASQDAVPP